MALHRDRGQDLLNTLKYTFSHEDAFVFRLVSLKSGFHFCASLNPAKVAQEQRVTVKG